MEVSSENSSASEEKEKVGNTALHERNSNADQTTSAVGAKESHSVSVPVKQLLFRRLYPISHDLNLTLPPHGPSTRWRIRFLQRFPQSPMHDYQFI